ncbi:hypothetical protein FGO68_gene17174 [Halteria grandinella]|uniref:Uncharacterized protein n=1 Tax=Halteria grandinella TaxID=5974 RepID=A0A8J8NRY6_HALGN|nr:hypothetical protein FGO68_gene17174 [Halteria grandinella]
MEEVLYKDDSPRFQQPFFNPIISSETYSKREDTSGSVSPMHKLPSLSSVVLEQVRQQDFHLKPPDSVISHIPTVSDLPTFKQSPRVFQVSPKQMIKKESKRYLKSLESVIPTGLLTSSKIKSDLLSQQIREKLGHNHFDMRKGRSIANNLGGVSDVNERLVRFTGNNNLQNKVRSSLDLGKRPGTVISVIGEVSVPSTANKVRKSSVENAINNGGPDIVTVKAQLSRFSALK